jgi:ubiquinone/menaquinone biosynthesis C-methylase UbiE
MTATPVDEFRCPACCGRVSRRVDLVCRECSRTYPIHDGIIDFRVENRDYYFNPVPRAEMQAIVRNMARDGWPRTVARFLRQVARPLDWIDNLTADGRYGWKLFLDLRPDGVLLDIGCGLGNLSYNLAPHVGKVYAMDLTYERVAFARRRFDTSDRGDHIVVVAGGDGTYLPFPEASLDYVMLSGVLEWVGDTGHADFAEGGKLARGWRMARSCFGERSPRAAQLRFLREIRRVLKPGGQLFVAIENRTGYRYFLGDPDHHSGLPYSSLLPRVVANLYSIWSARHPYRTYTYSIPGYRRLLGNAGFRSTRFFGLLPGYTHMRQIVPLGGRSGRWQPSRPGTLGARVAVNRYLVPAYGIVAGGRERQPSLVDEVIDGVEAALRPQLGAGRIQIYAFSVTGKDKGLLTAEYGNLPILIKLPFGAAALAGETANARFLAFAKRGFGRRLAYVPESLCSGVVRNVEYFVEGRCKGASLHQEIARLGRDVALAAVESVLEDLNPEPVGAGEVLEGDVYRGRVAKRLEPVLQLMPDPGLRLALEQFFRDRLHGVKVPRGVEHGDFGYDNILVDGDRISGLIDWEAADLEGIPLLDVLSYLEGIERLCGRRRSLAETIPLLAQAAWPQTEEWTFLERQYKRLGFDQAHHEGLVYLYWLQHVSSLIPYGLAYNALQVERSVLGVARQLLERA